MIPFGPKLKPDYKYKPADLENITVGECGWLEFDVTEDIIDFRDHSYLDARSYMIKKVCEKDFGRISFYSCQHGVCPELIIYLEAQCIEPPPTPCPNITNRTEFEHKHPRPTY